MNRFKILLLIFWIFQSMLAFSQTFWKLEDEHGDEILLTMEVNNAGKTFEAWSRKDALKDLAGTFTYALARAAGKLKYPEIVYLEGKTVTTNDSLLLTGTFNYFDKQYPFSASVSGFHFRGSYIDRGKSHPLKGIKVPDNKPIKDYAAMIAVAFSLTEKSLINPLWLQSDDWRNFKKKVNALKYKISDDFELAATYYWLGKKLPFAPYRINKSRTEHQLTGRKTFVGFREMTSNTARFDANSLPSSQKEMDSLAVVMNGKGVQNLIIDLRGANRLRPAAANLLINYLSAQPFIAGVYLTRKWSENNSAIPKAQDYQRLDKVLNDNVLKRDELYKGQGEYINIVPGDLTFKGKVFVLTDAKTSGVAEMLTYVLKDHKIAVIIGQKSAGVTVVAENIPINGDYDVMLPDCDFYTGEGKSLNQIGVEPDIQKSGDEVIKYVLSKI